MKILELFAGSCSIGKVAKSEGHEVFSSDIKQFGEIDYVENVLNFDYDKVPFVPDMIWMSPPCTGFSTASMGKHWGKYEDGSPYKPKTETAKLGIQLAQKSIEIFEHYQKINPQLIWYIENPRGVLRKMSFMTKLPIRNTVTYCKYGDMRMKPTDIWTNNDLWVPRKMCKNKGHGYLDINGETWVLNQAGKACHMAAPRGAKTGTQGLKGNYIRSMIPEELCYDVIKAAELKLSAQKHV